MTSHLDARAQFVAQVRAATGSPSRPDGARDRALPVRRDYSV